MRTGDGIGAKQSGSLKLSATFRETRCGSALQATRRKRAPRFRLPSTFFIPSLAPGPDEDLGPVPPPLPAPRLRQAGTARSAGEWASQALRITRSHKERALRASQFFDHLALIPLDEADDLHRRAALGTNQRIHLIDLCLIKAAQRFRASLALGLGHGRCSRRGLRLAAQSPALVRIESVVVCLEKEGRQADQMLSHLGNVLGLPAGRQVTSAKKSRGSNT